LSVYFHDATLWLVNTTAVNTATAIPPDAPARSFLYTHLEFDDSIAGWVILNNAKAA